jgi:Bacteriophage baseplate protein W
MAGGIVTLADITSADWSLKLDAPGQPASGLGKVVQGVGDVDQCIAIILTTPKGSDVLRPTFGTDVWRYIDAPISEAGPAIVREVTESITQWEPRVKVLSVQSTPVQQTAEQPGAHVSITVLWQLDLANTPTPRRTTVVAISNASAAG